MNRDECFEALQAEAARLFGDDDLARALIDDFALWHAKQMYFHDAVAIKNTHEAMIGFAMGYAARDQELAQDYALPDGK